tara:strand:- start:1166 stop:1579 length:414 start_codon:yes stop_codon:yes gene_type:complete
MQIEKKVFSKLFKEKTNLSKHKTKLGVTQDIAAAMSVFNDTLDTGEKVAEIGLRVNTILSGLMQDVRYYNEYKTITRDDITQNIDYVESLIERSENIAEELGVQPVSIVGFQDAQDYLINAERVYQRIDNSPLEFDI